MPDILPFRGIVYNTQKVKGDEVVSPPYDIVTPEMKEQLYRLNPYNIIRVDFGKDEEGDREGSNRYTRAREYLKQWLREGILLLTDREVYYLYEVKYRVQGQEKVMRGLFARVRITDLCEGVYPHEATHSKPKLDRLNLLRHCRANISPIFSIYNRKEVSLKRVFERVGSGPPYMEARDLDGFVHRMWILQDEEEVKSLQEALKDTPIYIADGHHRYETALEYMKETGGEGDHNYVLMYLVNMAEEELTILPTHRLLRSLPVNDPIGPLTEHFVVRETRYDSLLKEMSLERPSIGLVLHGRRDAYILSPKGDDLKDIPEPLRRLEVVLLHELILKRLYNIRVVDFEMNPDLVLKKVESGEYQGAFFLNPTEVEDVEKVALRCLRMPPKSTYFYPKILTGFVINPLDRVLYEGLIKNN